MTKDDYVLICKKCGDELGLEYVPNEQQEPYAYAYIREDGVGQLCWTSKDKHIFKDYFLEGWKEVPLYTHPHQWQGLTDDEIDKIYADTEPNSKMDTYYMVLSRAIEQALKEKNHGN